jgi:hypothetical protein
MKSRFCPICAKKILRGYVLYDRTRKRCGVYCSRQCAEDDAWGPRFRPFTVRIERKK